MAAPAASGNGGGSAEAGAAILDGRWRIGPDSPLLAFDRPSAQAFAAWQTKLPDRPLVGLVCTSGLPFRARPARLLVGAAVPGLLRLLAFGIVRWPPAQARVPVFIYERPAGDAVADVCQRRATDVAGDEKIRRLVGPIVEGLRELQRKEVAHRGIRPDNLWFRDFANDTAVLGCALTGPAGWDQPVPFEPIERAMAERAGRGEGDTAADIYALGVTVLWLLAEAPPWSDRAEAEVLAARMEQGSYPVLTQGIRVPESLIDPLRGMLADDPAMRWSIRDVQTWLDGARPPIRVSPPRVTAETPLVFDGKPYRGLRLIATAMAGNVPLASRIIRTGSLQSWLRHALRERARANSIDGLIGEAGKHPGEQTNQGDEALVARTLLLLDEGAPIRYRGVSFNVDGFGAALAKQMVDGGSVQSLAEAISLGLAERPLTQGVGVGPLPMAEQVRRATALAQYLSDPRPGFGIERCLYAENAGLPCLSPVLRPSGVFELADLLPELEAVAAALPDDKLVDRHVAAFIAARCGDDLDESLPEMANSDAAASATATLAVLGRLQALDGGAPRPRLARWIGRKLPAVAAAVRHRPTRAALELNAARLIAQGDLCALQALICDPQRHRREERALRAAVAAWLRAETELRGLDDRLPARQFAARSRGARFSSMIGLSAAFVSIGLTILLNLR